MKYKLMVWLVLIYVNFAFADEDNGVYPRLPNSLEVENVVLLIGDGMGIGQIMAARISSRGAFDRLNMEKMPVTGLVNTCSANRLITESGASGTALATGYKTNNNMISVGPEGQNYKTILEACKEIGMATGLIATSSITHATPACFAAHTTNRGDEPKIAKQIIENRVNVLLGGGREFFIPQSSIGSRRNDDQNLLAIAKKAGYSIVENKAGLLSADSEYLLGLFQMGPLNSDSLEPSLAMMTDKAIELLSRQNGFFLMVEGSQIDWGCHDNNIIETIKQILLFDEAVKIALDFASCDSHTLVIVLADHETGGLGVTGGSLEGKDLQTGWLGTDHTAVMIPVFAYGPKADFFTGVFENTEIPGRIARAIGIKNFAR